MSSGHTAELNVLWAKESKHLSIFDPQENKE